MISIGIDPGLRGAVFVLDDCTEVAPGVLGLGWRFWLMPTERVEETGRTQYHIPRIKAMLVEERAKASHDGEPLLATVEKQQPLPAKFRRKGSDEEVAGGGTIANFNRGVARGLFEGMCRALNVPILLVRPQTWQREMFRSVPDAGDTKERALAAVRELVPGLDVAQLRASPRGTKAHAGVVDALCLAIYGRWTMKGSLLEVGA